MRNYIENLTLAIFNSQSGNVIENTATLFEPTDKHTQVSQQRITQLEQLVDRLKSELDIHQKVTTLLKGERSLPE